MYILKYTSADLFPPNKARIHCNYIPRVWDLTSTHAEWVWTVGQVFFLPTSVSSSRKRRRSLRLLGFDSGGGAGEASGGSVWTTACHCSGWEGGRTHTLAGHCPSDTHTHTSYILSSINTHSLAGGKKQEPGSQQTVSLNISLFCLYFFWRWGLHLFFLFFTSPLVVFSTSMMIMVQWMCEVWCIFNRDSISGDAAWLGWPGAKYSHVIWRRSWRRLSRFFLFYFKFGFCGASKADGPLQPVHPPHCIFEERSEGGGKKAMCWSAVVLNGCVGCSSSSRVCAYCCCCYRPVRWGRTTLRGLFDVWQRCCQM